MSLEKAFKAKEMCSKKTCERCDKEDCRIQAVPSSEGWCDPCATAHEGRAEGYYIGKGKGKGKRKDKGSKDKKKWKDISNWVRGQGTAP